MPLLIATMRAGYAHGRTRSCGQGEDRNLIQMKMTGLLLIALLCANCSHSSITKADKNDTAQIVVSTPPIVKICDQTWMARNLDVATYRNGDPIPQIADPVAWVGSTSGAWCWYNNDSATYATYGRLYNWYAVNDTRGLAPVGWHVATDADWSALDTCLGIEPGYRLREAGPAHWSCPPSLVDNSSGFNGLPGGMRSEQGVFDHIGLSGIFWFSTEGSSADAWCYRLIHHVNNSGVSSMVTGVGYMNKADGYSVRCVKDR